MCISLEQYKEADCYEAAVSYNHVLVSVYKLNLQIRIRINEEQLKHVFVCQQVHYISKWYQKAKKK